ncbi:MAG: hypothetical protein KJ626_10325 [Verrucomicrobia bacterium]|nr:hypothetical protein [Verrucomicrobiota bacterium]
MGFLYCPETPVLSHATSLVVQLVYAGPDDLPGSFGLGFAPLPDDQLLAEVTINVTNNPGSIWADFVGPTYRGPTIDGKIFGRAFPSGNPPGGGYYYYFHETPLYDVPTPSSPPDPPMLLDFTPDFLQEAEIDHTTCLSCNRPCGEPVSSVTVSNGDVQISFEARDENATFQLQYSTHLASATWSNFSGVVTGYHDLLIQIDTNGVDAHRVYRVMKRQRIF